MLARAFSSWRVPRTTLSRMSSATMHAGGDLADHEAHRDDRDQHDVHRIAQLLRRHRPHRRRLLLADLVRPVPREPLRRLRSGQAGVRIRPQRGHDLSDISGVGRRSGRVGSLKRGVSVTGHDLVPPCSASRPRSRSPACARRPVCVYTLTGRSGGLGPYARTHSRRRYVGGELVPRWEWRIASAAATPPRTPRPTPTATATPTGAAGRASPQGAGTPRSHAGAGLVHQRQRLSNQIQVVVARLPAFARPRRSCAVDPSRGCAARLPPRVGERRRDRRKRVAKREASSRMRGLWDHGGRR